MRKYILLVIFATQFILIGCATVLSSATQQINMRVVDEKSNEIIQDVECIITDGEGMNYAIATNPGQLNIIKGNGVLTPVCKKDGYIQTSFGVGNNFDNITLINILFLPGFVVDAATGAIKEYPSHMTIYMKQRYSSGPDIS